MSVVKGWNGRWPFQWAQASEAAGGLILQELFHRILERKRARAESTVRGFSVVKFLKRTMDIMGAIIGLILLSPLMLVIALAIRLSSRGPAIFKQQRAGLKGQAFTCYKFRSMVADGEAPKKDLMPYNEHAEVAFKMADDPRVTRLGRFLRKTSLDELPQLYNVLRGDMSVV